jgi:hypothetical protein
MTSNRWAGCSIFSLEVFPLFLGIPFWLSSWTLGPYVFRVTKIPHSLLLVFVKKNNPISNKNVDIKFSAHDVFLE